MRSVCPRENNTQCNGSATESSVCECPSERERRREGGGGREREREREGEREEKRREERERERERERESLNVQRLIIVLSTFVFWSVCVLVHTK